MTAADTMTLVQPDDFHRPSDGRGRRSPGIARLIANGSVPTIALIATAGRRSWAPLAHVAGPGG